MTELAEHYTPWDDEIPGQDSLWDALDAVPEKDSDPETAEADITPADDEATAPAWTALNVAPGASENSEEAPTTAKVATAQRASSAAGLSASAAKLGITGRGVVVLTSAFTGLVGILDVIASGHRGHLFGVAFVLAAAVGGYVVRRRDVLVAVVAPPLIYCALIIGMSLIDTGGMTGSLLTRIGIYILDGFVTGAPTIWLGTAAASAIVWRRTGGTLRTLPPALLSYRRGYASRC